METEMRGRECIACPKCGTATATKQGKCAICGERKPGSMYGRLKQSNGIAARLDEIERAVGLVERLGGMEAARAKANAAREVMDL